jgi:AcrR family transcriptional regulator
MDKTEQYSSPVRKQHQAATRDLIIRTAMALLTEASPEGLSHETVAAKAQVAARTVYRHFRTRADLARVVWTRFQEATRIRLPETEADLAELPPRAFRAFDKHERLVRAIRAVDAGREGGDGRVAGDRPAFMTALGRVTAGMTPPQRARVVGIFLLLHNVSAWQTLRDEGQLSGQEAAKAVEWAARTLLDALGPRAGRETSGSPSQETPGARG